VRQYKLETAGKKKKGEVGGSLKFSKCRVDAFLFQKTSERQTKEERSVTRPSAGQVREKGF